MYHSFKIPRHGTSNTINNIGLNSFHSVYELLIILNNIATLYMYFNYYNDYFLICKYPTKAK